MISIQQPGELLIFPLGFDVTETSGTSRKDKKTVGKRLIPGPNIDQKLPIGSTGLSGIHLAVQRTNFFRRSAISPVITARICCRSSIAMAASML